MIRTPAHMASFRALLGASLLLLISIPPFGALAGQDTDHRTSIAPPPFSACVEGTEKQADPLPPPETIPLPRDPLIERLHQARKAGDLETVRAIRSRLSTSRPAGETSGKPTLRPPATVGKPGTPFGGDGKRKGAVPDAIANWGSDVKVRPFNYDTKEWNQTMASSADGSLFVAWQDDYWTQTSGGYDFIQIYQSTDGGRTWSAFGFAEHPAAHLREPSITVGGTDTLLVAYMVDDGVNRYPEVATTPLSSWSFTARSVPYWSGWDGYAKPVIWTDSVHFALWYAYLTCEGIYDEATNELNVCFWRSLDSGATWQDGQAVFGNTDSDTWRDADGSYGTSLGRVFLATYNDTSNTLYAAFSDDFGQTFQTPVVVSTSMPLSYDPSHPVDPDIEAAVHDNHVMLVCTFDHPADGQDDDDIGQTYSTDAGATWNLPLWTLEGHHATLSEFAPELSANEGGHSWHVAYTRQDWWVFYNSRPQDLSDLWSEAPVTVNDIDWASAEYPQKGIASHWVSDTAGIAWADFRDGSPDYDTYFDGNAAGLAPEIHIEPAVLNFVRQ